ncbi:MAG: Occludin/ELL family protein [Cyanobacteria bacterium K_Offshore_surface_m2_239]|nr:Occludin/ELL family protein [Cyanobacteria bacterium K_Offshore_surface_m2_239]
MALALAASSGSLLAVPASAQTGPVLCTTTLEAPLVRPGQPASERGGPREVTRCGVVGTVPDLVRQRYYSYRAPFARGVDLTHQITDFFGLAMGGGDGTRLMGLGFPDQAIIWDGVAIENTNRFLLDQQVQLVPRRTADLPSPFTTSVRTEGGGPSTLSYPDPAPVPR